MITDLAEPAPATTGWGRENERSHSCGKGWQFKRVLDYARNPTPPSACADYGQERFCLCYTYAPPHFGNWVCNIDPLFWVNQYPGGPRMPCAHGIFIWTGLCSYAPQSKLSRTVPESHRCRVSGKLAAGQSHFVSVSPVQALSVNAPCSSTANHSLTLVHIPLSAENSKSGVS